MSWGRSYSANNTRRLRKLIKEGRIVPDPVTGIIYNEHGKPYPLAENCWGYLRFRVWQKRERKQTWFFVAKAVFFSTNPKLKKHHEIDHVDFDIKNNRLSNLRYVPRKVNAAKKKSLNQK